MGADKEQRRGVFDNITFTKEDLLTLPPNDRFTIQLCYAQVQLARQKRFKAALKELGPRLRTSGTKITKDKGNGQ